MNKKTILLDDGSGGRATQRLINDLFLEYFRNDILLQMNDAATIPGSLMPVAISVDGYTVDPIFFPGGNIGSLAINGTVNDIAMVGASPRWLTVSFILEEGFELAKLEGIVASMAAAARDAAVQIVTGDTKVVPKGSCDQIFITTSGMGYVYASPQPSGNCAKPGDVVLVSGSVGDHGMAVMAARNDLNFLSDAVSDCAPLNKMVEKLINLACPVHVLRDPTRGGLATTLNEIAEQSSVGIVIDEDKIPINASVREGCAFLGLDPLYLANEGKCICILPEKQADKALEVVKSCPCGKNAAIIGEVTKAHSGRVIMRTRMGGERFVGMLEGAPLPRIC